MEKVQGTIEGLSKDGKRFKIGSTWYSCYSISSMNGAKVGDDVEFISAQKESGDAIFNNVKGTVTVLKRATTTPASGSARKYGEESPDRNMSIIRQNALTNAVNYYSSRASAFDIRERAPTEEEVLAIVTIAAAFARFSSGEYERDMANIKGSSLDALSTGDA